MEGGTAVATLRTHTTTQSGQHTEMPDVDPTMGEPEKPPSRLEQIKYYTSLFLGALAIVCVFGFLFLVPFVLDPAISTIMHQFVTEPVHCNVREVEIMSIFCRIFESDFQPKMYGMV